FVLPTPEMDRVVHGAFRSTELDAGALRPIRACHLRGHLERVRRPSGKLHELAARDCLGIGTGHAVDDEFAPADAGSWTLQPDRALVRDVPDGVRGTGNCDVADTIAPCAREHPLHVVA